MDKSMNIPDDQMIVSLEELKEQGLSYYKINKLTSEGRLSKLNNKF